MGICIAGKPSDVAERVLVTRRAETAQWVAEHFLEDVTMFHNVRSMPGYTGKYRGIPVTVQGLGFGNVSASMYVTELIHEFGAQCIIKVDTCKALSKELSAGDLVLPQSVYTTCGINRRQFKGRVFPCAADFDLLMTAYGQLKDAGVPVHVGPVASIETCMELPVEQLFAQYGAIASDDELNQVYTVAQKALVPVLGILSVGEASDAGMAFCQEVAVKAALDCLSAHQVKAPAVCDAGIKDYFR